MQGLCEWTCQRVSGVPELPKKVFVDRQRSPVRILISQFGDPGFAQSAGCDQAGRRLLELLPRGETEEHAFAHFSDGDPGVNIGGHERARFPDTRSGAVIVDVAGGLDRKFTGIGELTRSLYTPSWTEMTSPG